MELPNLVISGNTSRRAVSWRRFLWTAIIFLSIIVPGWADCPHPKKNIESFQEKLQNQNTKPKSKSIVDNVIKIDNFCIHDKIDEISGITFKKEVELHNIFSCANQTIIFRDCTFTRQVHIIDAFPQAEFHTCKFENKVIIKDTTYYTDLEKESAISSSKSIIFSDSCIFKDNIQIKKQFTNLSFVGCIFENEYLFEHALKNEAEQNSKKVFSTLSAWKLNDIFFPKKYNNGVTIKNSIFKERLRLYGSLPCLKIKNCTYEQGLEMMDDEYGFNEQLTEPLQSPISFTHCLFRGNLRVRRHFGILSFNACTFEENVSFGEHNDDARQRFRKGKQDTDTKKSVVASEITFIKSEFKKQAIFPYVKFSNATFIDTVFVGPTDFTKAKFSSDTDFTRAVFHSSVDFDRAIFFSDESADETCQAVANFYKTEFKKKASFSKTFFLIDTDFKRATFEDYAIFTNTGFSNRVSFNKAVFEKGLMGSKMNDCERLINEIEFYNEGQKRKERNETGPNNMGYYMDDTAYGILTTPKNKRLIHNMQKKHNAEVCFSEAQFCGDVDLRRGFFGSLDFGSKEIITTFNEKLDLSNASFKKICFHNAVFSKKVELDMNQLFATKGSGTMSERFTIFDIFEIQIGIKDIVADADPLTDSIQKRKENSKSYSILFESLEKSFREYGQIHAANEMSVRRAIIGLSERQGAIAKLSNLFVAIALPIRNIAFITVIFLLSLYAWMVSKKSIKYKTRQFFFKPTKLPLVLLPEKSWTHHKHIKTQDSDGTVRKIPIEHCSSFYQRLWWTFWLCVGTFFAVFSFGNEYYTDQKICLNMVKILRLFGFIMIPLLVYSIAKRSEGLHALVSFF